RQKKFGTNGELFQKQDELMKPIQNRVFDSIKKVAEEQDLDFVFDRSGDVLFLYAKEKYDITNLVLQKLK
ncbi:MAG: OmpH family outer membrane protein, partial [Acidobacteriota bacterium]